MMEKNVEQIPSTFGPTVTRTADTGRRKELPAARPAQHRDQELLVRRVYDALSRSELQNGQPLPSVSQYSDPAVNNDGSVDIAFGPQQSTDTENWIATLPGRGWFPIFRFYSPTEAYFDSLEVARHRLA